MFRWSILMILLIIFPHEFSRMSMTLQFSENAAPLQPEYKAQYMCRTDAFSCLGLGGYSQALHHGCPDSVPGQYIWVKWHWHRSVSEFFSLPLSLLLCQCSITIHPFITEAM